MVSIPGGGSAYTGRTRIDAGYQDVKDVTIVVRPGVDVPVQVIAKAGAYAAAVQNVELRIKDSPRPIGISSGRGGSESFLIQHVPAGDYEVFVTTRPTVRVADIYPTRRAKRPEGRNSRRRPASGTTLPDSRTRAAVERRRRAFQRNKRNMAETWRMGRFHVVEGSSPLPRRNTVESPASPRIATRRIGTNSTPPPRFIAG